MSTHDKNNMQNLNPEAYNGRWEVNGLLDGKPHQLHLTWDRDNYVMLLAQGNNREFGCHDFNWVREFLNSHESIPLDGQPRMGA